MELENCRNLPLGCWWLMKWWLIMHNVGVGGYVSSSGDVVVGMGVVLVTCGIF